MDQLEPGAGKARQFMVGLRHRDDGIQSEQSWNQMSSRSEARSDEGSVPSRSNKGNKDGKGKGFGWSDQWGSYDRYGMPRRSYTQSEPGDSRGWQRHGGSSGGSHRSDAGDDANSQIPDWWGHEEPARAEPRLEFDADEFSWARLQ